MSNIGEIKTIITKILADNAPHSLNEIKKHISSTNPDLNVENGIVSTALYQLRKQNPLIIPIDKKVYQLSPSESDITSPRLPLNNLCIKDLNSREQLCLSLIQEFDNIHILDELDYREYQQLQLCYKINKKY